MTSVWQGLTLCIVLTRFALGTDRESRGNTKRIALCARKAGGAINSFMTAVRCSRGLVAPPIYLRSARCSHSLIAPPIYLRCAQLSHLEN